MRTVGIIAEYNPFHTGHKYHLEKAKEISGADYAVVVMSPDFVQRGEPAVFDKYTRAKMALMNGADLVIELPVCYACGSAEYFAQGAVSLMDRLSVTDAICFGGESDDTPLFFQLARVLLSEPEVYVRELRRLIKEGNTYPQARKEALALYFDSEGIPFTDDGPGKFLMTPNNILGIEYCKALLRMNSPISVLPVKRKGSRYNSTALDGPYCSASALRCGIRNGGSEKALLHHIPENCRSLFLDSLKAPRSSDEFMSCLTTKLLSMNEYGHILDIGPDLSDRIKKLRFSCLGKSFDEVVALLKTKQITEVRIRRALLHLILDIRKEDVESFRDNGVVFYAKVLGFRREAAPLLHEIKKKSSIPLITKNARAAEMIDGIGKQMWEQDLAASHLYRALGADRACAGFRSEYEISPLIF